MSDGWKTLRVPVDAYDEAKEQKEAAGRTWGEQIVRDGDNDTTTPDVEWPDVDLDTDDLAHDISRQLDYDHLASNVAGELEGRMQR